MKKYNVIIKQSRTGLVLADFTELSKTKKFLKTKWRAKTMFAKPKQTVIINRCINYPGEQQTMFNNE